ncbi:hypothetical protein Q4354_03515 [Acinetobacter baumannii]
MIAICGEDEPNNQYRLGTREYDWHHHVRGQLLCVDTGFIEVKTSHGSWLLPPSRASWIPPGVSHKVKVSGALSGWTLFMTPILCSDLPQYPCVIGISELLRALARRASEWNKLGDLALDQKNIIAVIQDEIRLAPHEALHLPIPQDPRLERVLRTMLAEPDCQRSLDEWASYGAMSSRTLRRLILAETGLSFESIRRIEQKFYEYAASPWLFLDIPELKGLSENPFAQQNEQIYKIILASVQLDVLDHKDWTSDSEFRLYLRHDNIDALLKNMKKESIAELREKAYIEYANTQDLKKEAIKVLLELRKTLDLHTNEKNMDTVKKILKVSLKSNESFEQLQTALNSTNGKEIKPVNWHSGDIFLQGAGCSGTTNWAFEDGYIFVEGQPDAVLTHLWGSSVGISQRSNDPRQRWELK